MSQAKKQRKQARRTIRVERARRKREWEEAQREHGRKVEAIRARMVEMGVYERVEAVQRRILEETSAIETVILETKEDGALSSDDLLQTSVIPDLTAAYLRSRGADLEDVQICLIGLDNGQPQIGARPTFSAAQRAAVDVGAIEHLSLAEVSRAAA